MHIIKASPDPLLSLFRSLNEQRPTVPKEGGHLLAVFHDYALCIVHDELSQGEHFLAVL